MYADPRELAKMHATLIALKRLRCAEGACFGANIGSAVLSFVFFLVAIVRGKSPDLRFMATLVFLGAVAHLSGHAVRHRAMRHREWLDPKINELRRRVAFFSALEKS